MTTERPAGKGQRAAPRRVVHRGLCDVGEGLVPAPIGIVIVVCVGLPVPFVLVRVGVVVVVLGGVVVVVVVVVVVELVELDEVVGGGV